MAGHLRPWTLVTTIGAAALCMSNAAPAREAAEDDVVPLFNGKDVVDVDLAKTSRRDRPLVGYIGLQDHGLPLSFRNIRIKVLDDKS
jgi:hypothetical protein